MTVGQLVLQRASSLPGKITSKIRLILKSLAGKIASSTLSILLLWLLLLTLGNFLSSEDYTPHPNDGLSLYLIHFPIYLASWVWSNVAFLAFLAAVLGESQRVIQNGTTRDYVPALVRGFYAYLSVTAGYLVAQGGSSLVDIHPNVPNVATDPWVRSMSQAAYVRIAITVSTAGFLAGYAPNYFKSLLDTSIKHLRAPVSEEGQRSAHQPQQTETAAPLPAQPNGQPK